MELVSGGTGSECHADTSPSSVYDAHDDVTGEQKYRVEHTNVYSEQEKETGDERNENRNNAAEETRRHAILGPDTIHAGFSPSSDHVNGNSTVRTTEPTGLYLQYLPDTEHSILARKLYGMSQLEYEAHLEEKSEESPQDKRHICMGFYTIHPYSTFKLLWDLMMALLVAYTWITVPLELSFIQSETAVVVL